MREAEDKAVSEEEQPSEQEEEEPSSDEEVRPRRMLLCAWRLSGWVGGG